MVRSRRYDCSCDYRGVGDVVLVGSVTEEARNFRLVEEWRPTTWIDLLVVEVFRILVDNVHG